MQQWQELGPHRFRIEGDVLFAIAVGELDADSILYLCEKLLQVYKEHGFVYEIVDATRAGAMSAEARRKNAEWHRHNRIEGEVVVFGASLLLRTVFSLLINALSILGRSRVLLHFVATEDDARAWVAKRRQSRAAKLGH